MNLRAGIILLTASLVFSCTSIDEGAGDFSASTGDMHVTDSVFLDPGFTIRECGEWVTLENIKDFTPGSALDFSSMGFLDAPAGKYGRVKAKDGYFYFEDKPGVPQRFCGANLCMTANFLSHDLADSLIERFTEMGYNAIRIHHHDKDIFKNDNLDKLDYLIARAKEKGFYFTTDLYVSRNVYYKDIGRPESGIIPKGLFKNLIPVYEPAFQNWCDFARQFLVHVNKYTGIAYKDEPAIAFICMVNEGRLNVCGDKNYPPIYDEWIKWGGSGKLSYNSPGFSEFEEHLTRMVFEKCSAFVRSLGCTALLSNDNNGDNHGEGAGTTPLYDYVENHWYMDHPEYGDERNTLPATYQNLNAVTVGGPDRMKWDFVKTASKPYTVTEWNFCGPGRYRSLGGMMCGAMAAVRGWDGLWRFAYSHSLADVAVNPDSYPSSFNLATDPLNLASERTTVLTFLRGDLSEESQLQLDQSSGIMRIVSERSCGFFTYSGKETAGALSATISLAPATLSVSSLDGKSIKNSSRMLLTHLTDVQGNGIRYDDDRRRTVIKWGKGTLLQKGRAEVELALDSPASYKVYELKGNGDRVREIFSMSKNGKLCFTITTDGPSGGRMYYEITKQ